MTLGEFADGLAGFNELERDRLQWTMFNTRRICYYTLAPHLGKNSQIKKEQDLFPLDMDKEMEELRIKNLPVATVTFDE